MPGAGTLAGRPGTGLPRLLARRLLAHLGLCPDPLPHRRVHGLRQAQGIDHQGGRGSPRGQRPPPRQWWLGSPGVESAGDRETKCPFSPSPGKMCVCVCVCKLMPSAPGRGEERPRAGSIPTGSGELGAGPARVPLRVPACASVCRRLMHFRLGVFMYVMCVSYSSLCFSFLVLGSFPHPRHGFIILMAFYSFLFFFCLNLQFWKLLAP